MDELVDEGKECVVTKVILTNNSEFKKNANWFKLVP